MSEYITSYFNNIANGVKSFISGLVLTFDHMKNKKENVATLQYPHEKFPVPDNVENIIIGIVNQAFKHHNFL